MRHSGFSTEQPVLLYAFELFLSRDEIKQSRGKNKEKAAETCVETILQDAAKREASAKWFGFVEKTQHVAFLKGTSAQVQGMIRKLVGKPSGISLVFSD